MAITSSLCSRNRKLVRLKTVEDEVREGGMPWLVQRLIGQGKEFGSHSKCNEKPLEGVKLGSGMI